MSVENFLKKYYRQMHFNAMSPEVRARLNELIKKDSLTRTQRNWVKDYMHKDGDKYVQNDLPSPDDTKELSDEDLRELFIVCQNAFAGMNGALATFKESEPESKDFLNLYFGDQKDGKLFNISPASRDCATGIKEIVDLLKRDDKIGTSIRQYVFENTKQEDGKGGYKAVFDKPEKLIELLDKCGKTPPEYDTNASVQDKITKVAKVLSAAIGFYSGFDRGTPQFEAIENLQYLDSVLADDAFSKDPKQISKDKLNEFKKNIKSETGILKTLYNNKIIRDRFAKYDHGTITGVIEDKAENEIDYQKKDSENYLAPKYSDVLTPIQQLEKWKSDTYNNTLKKYEELRGAHLFDSAEAQDIFKAIDKEKIKPVDGLAAILSKESDIKKRLISNPLAKQHFDWFLDVIKEVQNEVPKAIEGAWKNSRQMKCVIEKIILKATDPQVKGKEALDAMEKAQTAMQIMTAMKYGLMTSKIMDAMKQTDFTMFSDGKLSWNKNESVQFITKAFDKSVKFAFKTVGFGVTIAKNKIYMSRMSFNNKDNEQGNLASRLKTEKQKIDSDKAIETGAWQNEIDAKTKQKKEDKKVLSSLAKDGIKYGEIRNQRAILQGYKKDMDDRKDIENEYLANQQLVEEQKHFKEELSQLKASIPFKQMAMQNAENDYKNPDGYKDMPEKMKEQRKEDLYNIWQESIKDFESAKQELVKKQLEFNANKPIYDQALIDLNANRKYHLEYNNAEKKYNKLNNKLEQFKDAAKEIREINKVIKEREDAINKWDKEHVNRLIKLEKYWNYLQSGEATSFRLFTDKAQKKYDEEHMILFEKYAERSSLAA